MKYIIAIFFTAINCIASTNSVVVFSKETADGGKLKVEFRSLPFELIKTTNANIDTFLSNAFGFGGTNSSLIVKKFKK